MPRQKLLRPGWTASIVAFATIGLTVVTMAALPIPDKIPATGGTLTIQPIYHATLQIVQGGRVIDVDPVAQGDYTGLAKPDIILITDIHSDHCDPATVAKLRKDTTKVVVPEVVDTKFEGAIVMANGDTKTIDGVTIKAVPMYNLTRGAADGQVYHEKGRGNGYVLTLGDKRIYIAGDTEGTPEMMALKNIDVAFIPMNLPYTMPPLEAAVAVRAFAPKIVYPYHYRGSDPTEFAKALAGTRIDVRLRDWYGK
jgi:L-ascorbate metabolism protein UlaG (beta-lactamase superfamily)